MTHAEKLNRTVLGKLFEAMMTFIIPTKWLSNPELGWDGGRNVKNQPELYGGLWAICSIVVAWIEMRLTSTAFGYGLGPLVDLPGIMCGFPVVTVAVCLGLLFACMDR